MSYNETLLLLDHIILYQYAVVLGGDVLDQNDQYTYLNWSYQPKESLSRNANILESCQAAKRYIQRLPEARARHYIIVLDDATDQTGSVTLKEND